LHCGDGDRVIQNTGPKYLFCEGTVEQRQRKLRAMDMVMRMKNSYDIAQARCRAGQIKASD
jgi:hypothetical protein